MNRNHSFLLTLCLAIGAAGLSHASAVFVPGDVPDWNQPYQYHPLPAGPGPDPNPAGFDPFDAWCTPTSASNLLGHWEDVYGFPVSDHLPFPGSLPWPGPPLWHDWNLGDPRPAPGVAPVGIDGDLGWFMDTNNTGSTLRSNGFHIGTFLKDTHVGLAELLVQAASLTSGVGTWTTGTRAPSFALGLDSSGATATAHPTAASAFAEIKGEIDAGRTILVTWSNWNIVPGPLLPPSGVGEASYGGAFHTFLGGPPSPDPWGNGEDWEVPGDPGLYLGHVTTAVGYIVAGDPDDPNAPGNPTDWVIVHDNAVPTPRNVIVPLTASEYGTHWVGNTNANRVIPLPALGPFGLLVLCLALIATAWWISSRRRMLGPRVD